ncbi:MAG: 16S rRNA (adenine(1518)-N(6)/adenine(1519)-N(6))-dimethyltransferase RsmA [Saprospiraceae bacterium]|nr:16S rRNA (adenine(1518)-N(6)/adenine(1519)-N(6))-dimethyltransferase RsmA [Saprospiraceae bacterium]
MTVRAKKHLGQHFLNDENIAQKIVNSLSLKTDYVLEIGPGMGVLTKYLIEKKEFETFLIEIDNESVDYLNQNFPQLQNKIFNADFLKLDLNSLFNKPFSIIGNFPYNISSQILFKVIDYRDKVPEVVGMFQKEVAERIASPPGSKKYGVISVMLQAFYNIEYLFTVNETVFTPPPKVKSAVIRLTRNSTEKLDCDEVVFKRIVKATFNVRRKTLRNGLKTLNLASGLLNEEIYDKRPEQLSVKDFVEITKNLQKFFVV